MVERHKHTGFSGDGEKINAKDVLNLISFVNANISTGLSFKIGTTRRITSTAAGTENVTGVGFQPSVIIFFGVATQTDHVLSWGFADGTTDVCTYYSTGGSFESAIQSIYLDDLGNSWIGDVTGVNSDGFDINWVKNGSGLGITIHYLALK